MAALVQNNMIAYGIKDENNNIWLEELSYNKNHLIQSFIQAWLPRCQIDSLSAYQIFKVFEKSGWSIVEFSLNYKVVE